ncbi:hypothetical protein TrCOL_g9641 [Triparma columacea]|uniref:Tyrosine-protein kinase ephrin type A/B receptor-like domain-containing protein n=1 Tax=Triparma columacea TaxID=722753 RepID=A0A9W7GMI0_9STRA|nr:hypothetical protein TrCOL_g9641 [Triparma columacea]
MSTGATSDATCQECEAGKYSSTTAAITCQGTFSSSLASTTCEGCAEGKLSPAGSTQCFDACPPPTLPTDGQACIGCKSGEYVNTELKECFPCAQGSYQPESNQDSCIDCPDGQTGLTFGAKSLEEAACVACLCPVGTRCDPADNEKCIPCLAGTHAPLFGSEQCTKCPEGCWRSRVCVFHKIP